jgi:hypothetical protein
MQFYQLDLPSLTGETLQPTLELIALMELLSFLVLSGIASLVLTSSEVNHLDLNIKVTLQRQQKLRDTTPECVVMFLGGHLPGKALLHLRLLSIYGMVFRLSGSVIHKVADYQLTIAMPASGSWFLQIRKLCLK